MFNDTENPRGIPARTVPFTSQLDDQFLIRLRCHVQRLRLIVPVLSISVLALKRQAAELDDDIASVLHLSALGPLDHELDQLEELLESVATMRVSKEGSR